MALYLSLCSQSILKMKKIIALNILLIIGFSCAKVPMTGRKQVKLVSSSTMQNMSYNAYKGFLDTNNVLKSGEDYNMVKSAGNNIKSAVMTYMNKNKKYKNRVKGYEWDFNLVVSEAVNAWCMPGGKVAFYTGIMPICDDETGVAVVMGHEIAHAIAGHGNERMSQGVALQMGGVAVSVAVAQQPAATQNIFLGAYGVGAQLGGMLPFSRLHESEADKMGLMFMAMAGYNPNKAVDFWKRMDEMSGGGAPPEILSTHPSHDTRITNIKKWLPEAMGYYNASNKK